MASKKKVQKLTDEMLRQKIDRMVAIRPVANEYRDLCRDVRAELMERNPQFFETPAGNRAAIKRKPVYTWLIDGLEKILSAPVFDLLCPRKADAKKLNQRLAAMPEDTALAKCRVELGAGKPELEVLAAGETVASEDDEDEEEAA